MTAIPVSRREPVAGQDELAELKLPPLSWQDKLQNTVYAVLGLHAGVFIMTFFVIVILEARYRFGDTVYSLAPAWNNLPVTLNLTAWLNWIAVPHTGGLGSWIINNWDLIQHTYFNKIPAGIIGFTFIGLLLGLGAGKPLGKPKWVDRRFIWLNDHFKVFPNRFQGYKTTTVQYAFLPLTGLLAALPGVIVASVIIYGGAALLHSLGLNPFGSGLLNFSGFNSLRFVLAGSLWQPIVIGAAGQHFYGRYLTLKAGESAQAYFLENRANNAYDAGAVLEGFKAGSLSETLAINELSSKRKATPGKVYPPIYRHRLAEILAQRIACVRHGTEDRIVMPFIMLVLTTAIILGGYWYLYLPKHGGWLP